jgi:hypothetical protein
MATASPVSREEVDRSHPQCSNGGAAEKKVRGDDGADEGDAVLEARVAGRALGMSRRWWW